MQDNLEPVTFLPLVYLANHYLGYPSSWDALASWKGPLFLPFP